MKRISLYALLALLSHSAYAKPTTTPSGQESAAVGPVSPLLVDQLRLYESQQGAGYRLFYRPTMPPGVPGLTALAEETRGSVLAIVFAKGKAFVDLVREASTYVPVVILVDDHSALGDAIDVLRDAGLGRALATEQIKIIIEPTNSIWIRDYAPIYVTDSTGKPYSMDFMYNEVRPGAEQRETDEMVPYLFGDALEVPTYRPPLTLSGGNFATDGKGTCFTSTATIRDNGGNRMVVDTVLSAYCGCKSVVYLEPLPGPTTEHIDMFFRVVAPDTVLLGYYEPRSAPVSASSYLQQQAHERMERNYRTLLEYGKAAHRNVQITRVPMPDIAPGGSDEDIDALWDQIQARAADDPDSQSGIDKLRQLKSEHEEAFTRFLRRYAQTITYRTYLNYVRLRTDSSDVVIVPQYREDLTNALLISDVGRIYSSVFSGAKIVFLDADSLITAQGAFHCITHLIPKTVANRWATLRDRGETSDTNGVLVPAIAEWPDGDRITESDVEAEFHDLEDLDSSTADGPYEDVLRGMRWREAQDNVIERRAREKVLKKYHDEIGSDEIAAFMRTHEEECRDNEKSSSCMRRATDALEKQRLEEHMGIAGDTLVADAELRKAYDDKRWQFTIPEQTVVIWAKYTGNARPIATAAQSTALARLRSTKCGARFIATAPGQKNLFGQATTDTIGGDELFSTTPDVIRDEITYVDEAGAVDLVCDDVSCYGYKVCDHTPEQLKPFEECRAQLRREVLAERSAEGQRRMTTALMNGVRINQMSLPEHLSGGSQPRQARR